MRTIECDLCGETITGADDAELAGRLGDHLSSVHERELPRDELEGLIAGEAYDAMDS